MQPPTAEPELPAGDFSAWLRHARSALINGHGTDVECGTCTACCSSSYFIHIRPEETETLEKVGKGFLAAAPGHPKGHKLLAYDQHGICPMLIQDKCSIYPQRPKTCRSYDCRVFAAAGIAAGAEDKARINERVRQWRFAYPAERDRRESAAVRAAARFIRGNAAAFPGGRIPDNPSQLAILAIKVYEVFMDIHGGSGSKDPDETAREVVAASRRFDALPPDPPDR